MTDQLQPTMSAVAAPQVRIPLRLKLDPAAIWTYGILSVGAIVLMLPFVWMLSASFKPADQILIYPPQLIPTTWTLDNYAYVLGQTSYLTFVKNSFTVAFFTLTGHIVSGSLVAYGFARFRFPG